jgi:hypothetical protein
VKDSESGCRLWLEALETRLVPSGSDWSMYNFETAGSRDNVAEHILGPSNVGGPVSP